MTMKLIVSDLDGTLLNENHQISEETAKAMRAANDVGIRFLTATGRAWSTAFPLLETTGVPCDFVLLNGAEFRDSTGKLIYGEAISDDIARKILCLLQDWRIDYEINTETGDYSTDTKFCTTAFPVPKLEELWQEKPVIRKIFAFSQEPAKLEELRKILKPYDALTVTASASWNVEITSSEAKKGIMTEKAAEYYGISKNQVLVFGDGENDKTMFQRFVHSRAMENAVPCIRELAEKIVESNQEDGVAKEIRRILEWRA